MDHALAIILAPLVVLVLIIAWLMLASRNGRSIKLAIRGLGLSVSLDSRPGYRTRDTDMLEKPEGTGDRRKRAKDPQ